MDENFSNKLITPSLIPNFINNKNYVNNTYNFIKKPIQPDFTLGSKNLVGHKNTSNINYMNKYNNIISRHNINNLPINKLYGHGKIMSQNNTNKYAYNFTNNKIYSDIYTREINNTFNYIKNQNKIKYGATNIQNTINGQNNNILNNRTATLNTNSMQNGNIVVLTIYIILNISCTIFYFILIFNIVKCIVDFSCVYIRIYFIISKIICIFICVILGHYFTMTIKLI